MPPTTRRSHKLGWCQSAETAAAFKVALDAREDARRSMHIKRDKTACKTLRMACPNLGGVGDARLHAYIEEHLAETGRLLADTDQCGFYEHQNGTAGLGGKNARNEEFIMDEDGTPLKNKVHILQRCARISLPSLIRFRLNLLQISATYCHNVR